MMRLEREESKILEIIEKFKERKRSHIPFAHKIKHFYLLISEVSKISLKFIIINLFNSENISWAHIMYQTLL